MRLADLIQSLQRADELDHAYKTRTCLNMSYPLQPGKLPRKADRVSPMPAWLDEDTFEAGLGASGLLPIVEHLYPHETSQRQ